MHARVPRRRGVVEDPLRMLRGAVDSFRLSPGEFLFREGDQGDCMYVVLEGSLDIMISDAVVETVGEGGIFGEMALIDDSPRAASAIARTACRLVSVDRKRFHLMVDRNPSFSTLVMKLMADRLRHMNELFIAARKR